MNIIRHNPAFAGKIAKIFDLKEGSLFLDLTLGDGGHTQEALDAGARVVSLDVDLESINRAITFLESKYQPLIIQPGRQIQIPTDSRWLVIHSNFREIQSLQKELNLPLFDAVLADLGTSQYQVAVPERGFSFNLEGPLDMRLDPELKVTAADLVNGLPERELVDLFMLADEFFARKIARAIVNSRIRYPFKTTSQLANLIRAVKRSSGKTHPATKVFMALRMVVNLEREALEQVLLALPNLTKPGATAGVISFHSGEDRLVKHSFKKQADKGIFRVINVKPIKPDENEIQSNSKIRSAKLRLVTKI